MIEQCFSLQPFPRASPRPCFQITGSIARRSNRLAIRYALLGPLAEFTIPAPAAMPTRKNGLWEETCFEFFLAVMDSPGYWECNLSPAGHWNVYRFAAYRQGMQEEGAIVSLPFAVRNHIDTLELALDLDLDPIVRADQGLEAAISAVIKRPNGEATYWALTHRGSQADFHRRDGFIVTLQAGAA
jgi:hypothetical protein